MSLALKVPFSYEKFSVCFLFLDPSARSGRISLHTEMHKLPRQCNFWDWAPILKQTLI